ncbi:3-hydroxyacyl-CoA dehydrogenase family protein [Arthrobacter sp. KNU40]|uniref:3-hydroxyacyl-CoA dehydrogenase family protein n=1 Tax=Arthrobacter sp. KNU40 TaxID=3447965 RepID=UPI003F63661B
MKLETVRNVAVFGAGTMGSGIAFALARFGCQISIVDRNSEALERSMSIVESSLDLFVEEGLVDRGARQSILDRIVPTTSGEVAARDADLVVECIVEDRDAKRELYEQLDRWCREQTIIVSNTSYLDVFELLPVNRLPNAIIAHWFAPPHIIPLVEVVPGEKTSQETVDLVVAWLKDAQRVPIVMNKFIDGFCINRLQRALGREIFFLLDNDYISPEMLDIAVKASIVPRSMVLGLVQRYDFTGLDLSYSNLQNSEYREPPLDNNPRSLVEKVERGDLGVKTGKGFFDYADEPLVDVLRRRDARLLEVFAKIGDLTYQRV